MTLINSGLLPEKWRAGMAWCGIPRDNQGARAFFRRTFEMAAVPESFRIFVSADSRYRLYLNGVLLGRGPLKGTLQHYNVEEFELAGLLHEGTNVLAADVIWFGVNSPLSEEHSGYAGFLLQGPEEAGVDTPNGWKAHGDISTTWDMTGYTSNAHIFLKGMERIEGAEFPIGWSGNGFDDTAWPLAVLAVPLAAPGGDIGAGAVWNFAPRDIPALIEEPRRFARTLENMIPAATHLFGETPLGWNLEANEGGEIVLDAGCLTTGFPVFEFDGGEGRTVEIAYAECILRRVPGTESDDSPYRWGAGGRLYKGIRDDIEGGVVHGYQDTVVLPGGPFSYEPHHWRTFWYVKITVSPGPTVYHLRDASYRFTTYPQTLQASFDAQGEPDMGRLWSVSWRTLQLCSHETYEDCPGYEQLHYLLDARNEALISLAMTGDTAMPRRTITLFRDTLRPDGMLSSRTPSQVRQTIPIFALWWVQMVLDYWDWAGASDAAFVRSNLFAVDGVLSYFREYLRDDGFLGVLPHWNPIGGEDAPGTDLEPAMNSGGSTYTTALYLMALEAGKRLHREVGHSEDAARWQPTHARLREALAQTWSQDRGVFVESLRHQSGPVSQHTQAMVILSGAATLAQGRRAAESIAAGVPAAKMTRQQGFPFSQAMRQVGRYDIALAQYLAEYREQLDLNLSTWVEGGLGARSDCHAWSAWLPVELLNSVLGIRPHKPGFAEILIAPELVFPEAQGTMPTPVGDVSVSWTTKAPGQIERLDISAPQGIPVLVQLPGQSPLEFAAGGEISISP